MIIIDLLKTFDRSFGISSIASPIGSCRDDFLLDRAVGLIQKSDLENNDKEKIVNLFKKDMFHSLRGFDNGTGAGRHYVKLIKTYFNL